MLGQKNKHRHYLLLRRDILHDDRHVRTELHAYRRPEDFHQGEDQLTQTYDLLVGIF